jgi:molybdenum cofactor cytidylyltransferase
VEAAVQDLPIVITRNADWQNGQSTSMRAGLRSLTPTLLPVRKEDRGEEFRNVGSAIFLLCDQPQITAPVIRALVEQHTLDLSPIIAPMVAGQRANPVLFDRDTFSDLMALTGDVGGRAIFSKYQVSYLPWVDESLLMDVDSPADLEKLRVKEA